MAKCCSTTFRITTAQSSFSSTLRTGKSMSFMRWNTASSSASRLMLTRCKPAALSALACFFKTGSETTL